MRNVVSFFSIIYIATGAGITNVLPSNQDDIT